eukprot:scaffold26980_cov130-Amphora_coffeaeformis.AAC.6
MCKACCRLARCDGIGLVAIHETASDYLKNVSKSTPKTRMCGTSRDTGLRLASPFHCLVSKELQYGRVPDRRR